MSPVFAKVLAAALAVGCAQALPANELMASSTSSSVAMKHTSPPAKQPTLPVPPTGPSTSPQAPDNTELIKDLKVEPSAQKRLQKLLLGKDGAILTGNDLEKQVVFDFKATASKGKGAGGSTSAANINTFPILTDFGISTTVAFLDKCGMNTPHIHPRATEFLTVVDGELDFGFIFENNFAKKEGSSNEVAGHLKTFQGTVFPMGSIHYQFNNNCKPATFVASLNSEDPGTSQIAQNFFGLNANVVNVTLGFPQSVDGKNIEQFRGKIPANLAQDIDNCLKKCGGK